MKKLQTFVLLLAATMLPLLSFAQEKKPQPPIVHSKVGTQVKADDGSITLTLSTKHQNFNWSDTKTLDKDIISPKSVNVHPNGTKYYVNSLEGCRTVVYDCKTNNKLAVIEHRFTKKNSYLWSEPSGFYNFSRKFSNPTTFQGKPVESAFSHNGRYLWVPYYRRSYDNNAKEPSAIAVIDTRADTIVRMMETGVLPKMIAASPDGKYVAVSHWGDNTVGLINVSSNNPKDWKHEKCVVIGYRVNVAAIPDVGNVNRDVNSGYCLRGTTFTPDSRYLFVGCMGGGGGLAVVDMQSKEYLGQLFGMKGNMRHIEIKNGYVYLSINNTGYIQRIPLNTLLAAIPQMVNKRGAVNGWESYKTGAGARTLVLSPSGTFIFVACNSASRLEVFRVATMKKVASMTIDSYPVGLDVSPNAKHVYVTSQGRSGGGGNAVNVIDVEYH